MCKTPELEGPTLPNCCARRLLGTHPDFRDSLIWIMETAAARGHLCIFFPKFHSELNFIEMIWAYGKGSLRRNCTFSFKDLQNKLPDVLNSVPLSFIKKASRQCFRFMDAYRQGLPAGPIADYAMKKYTGHRRLQDIVLGDITFEYESKKAAKKARKNP